MDSSDQDHDHHQLSFRAVFIATLLDQLGAAFLWPLIAIYINEYLHQSLTVAGIVLLFVSITMAAGNLLGGRLFDHWKPYPTLIGAASLAVLSTAVLIWNHSWPWFAVLLIINAFADGIIATVVNAYTAATARQGARTAFNTLYIAVNLGIVLGTLLVGVLLPISAPLVFAVATGAYILLLMVCIVAFRGPVILQCQHRFQHQKEARSLEPQQNRNRFVVLTACACLASVYLGYALWESIMPAHMAHLGIPFVFYSFLWTFNGLMIICCQPLVNVLGSRIRIDHQIESGVFLFGISFLILVGAHNFWMILFAFIIATVGDMLSLPAVPAWIDQLTPASQRGKYQGLPSIAMAVGRSVGPLYGGALVDHGNYAVLFISVAVLILGLLVALVMIARRQQLIRE
ncbi:MFS transporter [Ligilactobacillus sp. LYQ60]|uniref:MFS transporter n=1 Tax=unclassified Ligilactobacillus TaxID=2767920 RepID=UPI0038526682